MTSIRITRFMYYIFIVSSEHELRYFYAISGQCYEKDMIFDF